jgi:hypothetical protein
MMSKKWTAAVCAVMATCLACSKDKNEASDILPIHAVLSITAPAADPVVFFKQSPVDTTSNDDVVFVDVMLHSSAMQSFDAFDLEIRFNPGLVQVGRVNGTATPLGNCDSSDPCHPICQNNAGTPSPNANVTGDLIIGVAAQPGCMTAAVPPDVKLLTLGFFAAAEGSSTLELVDGPGTGDCEILSDVSALPIPCDSGNATVNASR